MILKIFNDYSRHEVQQILDPNGTYNPGRGTWGIRGIIQVQDEPGDIALFVTFGRKQGNHQFNEAITNEGILRWQSEPEQELNYPIIKKLFSHNEQINLVHLFLRTAEYRNKSPVKYTYLGPLKYSSHDRELERPVHAAWELMVWPIPKNVLSRMELSLVSENIDAIAVDNNNVHRLIEEPPPAKKGREGELSRQFRARKTRYQSCEQLRELGLAGELLVIERERSRLVAAGLENFAEEIEHTSVIKGDGAGYDIKSFSLDGSPRYIEVKTTTGSKQSDFFISPNEVAFSEKYPESFELCRVFDFDAKTRNAYCYSIRGNMRLKLGLVVSQYRAGPYGLKNTRSHAGSLLAHNPSGRKVGP